MLTHIDFLNEQIVELDTEVAKRVDPFQQDLDRLDCTPFRESHDGPLSKSWPKSVRTSVRAFQVQLTSAHGSVSFQDITKVPVNANPPQLENAINISVPLSLKPLIQFEVLTTTLGAQYRRIAARKGKQRAAVAVAHSTMTIAYHVLTRVEAYRNLGANYFETRQQDIIVKQSVRELENLGFTVTLSATTAS
jgi:transposase